MLLGKEFFSNASQLNYNLNNNNNYYYYITPPILYRYCTHALETDGRLGNDFPQAD